MAFKNGAALYEVGTYAFAEAIKSTTRGWETLREHHQGSGLKEEEIARERFLFHLDGALAAAKGVARKMFGAPGPRMIDELSTLTAHLFECLASIFMVIAKNAAWHGMQFCGFVVVEVGRRLMGATLENWAYVIAAVAISVTASVVKNKWQAYQEEKEKAAKNAGGATGGRQKKAWWPVKVPCGCKSMLL